MAHDAEDYLVGGENLLFRVSGRNGVIAVTTTRLLIVKRGTLHRSSTSIILSHISSIRMLTTYRRVIAGLLIVLVSLAVCYLLISDREFERYLNSIYGPDTDALVCSMSLLFVFLGLLAAVAGWLNRNQLLISYPSGRVVLRGGGWVREVERALLEALASRGTGRE